MRPTLHHVRCLSLAGFHRIAVWEWSRGDSGPPVVCVHGLTRQARDFDALAEHLAARGRRVLCVDLVGRGHSDWLSDPLQYHLVQYASDLNTVLAWARAQEVDWVGTSLGGLVGLMLAAQSGAAPIRRLVLNDIGPYIPSTALQRIGSYLTPELAHFPSLDAASVYLRRILQPFGELSEDDWRHLAKHSYRFDPACRQFVQRHDPAIARTYRQWQYLSVDLWRSWRRVRCRSLVLRGANSDFLLPSVVERMRQSPDVCAIELPGCGHAPALLRAEQIEPVSRFLLEREASG
ncbi:MAG: alpha/beta hydrolase [Burkholderiaceae bacterium]|nr:alpha/beta hydrolase [Burkholderiaceae bacterium]